MRGRLEPKEMVNSVRATVHAIDPLLPLTRVESMQDAVEGGQASQRFDAVLISLFACVAVLLAVIGCYSVIAAAVALRTQEMAIRLALGAQRSSVAELVLAWSVRLGLVGCGLGVLVSLCTTRLLRSLLFRVDPMDALNIAGSGLLLLAMVIGAAIVPALRAARLDPLQALHVE